MPDIGANRPSLLTGLQTRDSLLEVIAASDGALNVSALAKLAARRGHVSEVC